MQQVGTSYIKNNNHALVFISRNHHFWLITIIKVYLDFAETPTSTMLRIQFISVLTKLPRRARIVWATIAYIFTTRGVCTRHVFNKKSQLSHKSRVKRVGRARTMPSGLCFHLLQFSEPAACGSPDRQLNTTITGGDHTVGKSIAYSCPEGHMLVGNATRECLNTGFWSGGAPNCKCKWTNAYIFMHRTKTKIVKIEQLLNFPLNLLQSTKVYVDEKNWNIFNQWNDN